MSLSKVRFAVLAWAGVMASGAQAVDLEQAYRDAVTYDATLSGARASLAAGREKLPQGRAGLLPTISLSGNTNYNTAVFNNLDPHFTSKYNSHSWIAQLNQPLFRWQNWVQFKQGELNVGLAEAQFKLAEQDLVLRVAQAYFDVLAAQDTLVAASALRDANAQQLALAKKSFEVGTVTITDVHEAQSRYDLSSAQTIAAESDLEVRRNALAVLTGKTPDALKTLRKGVALSSPEPADMPSWVSASEATALQVQAAQLGVEIAAREIERNRAGHAPTVDLVASYGNSVNPVASVTPTTNYDSRAIGLQVAIPLYQGGGVNSRVREAIALRDKAAADLDNARRTAAQAARQAYLGVTSGLAQVRALE
ncbi:MAG TPA: TolC family outer membrane protein, partial [Rhodocyclaceae bacterium]|nr:TolC family outer membrane protein [Rhodocyclaceae bacterium]